MVTSSGVLELRENSPSEEPEVDYEPESPSANEDLPLSPSSLAASSSQPEVSSSSQPAESSSGPASSAPSVVESSSSTVSSLAVSSSEPEKEPPQNNYQSTAVSGEVRAIWISYLDFNSLLKGRTQAQFTANIQGAFDNIKEMGLNTVFVQVRPYGDALYDSDYFPWSHTITGTEGVNPGYDPLAIMVKEAHARGLSIEAWINPYRVRHSGTTAALSSDNQAQKWLSAGSDSVVKTAVGIYYNPGSEEARQLIVDGVKEIVANYNVDGIHFDDYFYPTTDASFDSGTYAAYQNSGRLAAGERQHPGAADLRGDQVHQPFGQIRHQPPGQYEQQLQRPVFRCGQVDFHQRVCGLHLPPGVLWVPEQHQPLRRHRTEV